MVAGVGTDDSNGTTIESQKVDLRSDTVTKPSDLMRKAMSEAAVGDDVFGDDPTVMQLEAHVANMLGKEAALFVTSGTQGNLIAVGVHCTGRGEEVICGKDSHTFFYEQGGASSLMGVVFNTVPNQPDGTLDLADIRKVIKPADNPHFAAAKLVIVENTQNKMGGCVLPIEYMEQVGAFCRDSGLKLHIDGARLWNAAVKLRVPVHELTKEADSVTVCLSKGLGAPVGSVLAGDAAFILKARRLRKALGGGLRQVGVLGAAGLYAVQNNFERLGEDHVNAEKLAKGLVDLGLKVVQPETNMVFFEVENAPQIVAALETKGVRILCIDGKKTCRAVANLHVSSADIDLVVGALRTVLEKSEEATPQTKKQRVS